MGSFLEFELLLQVNNLSVATLNKCIIVCLKIGDKFGFALPRSHQIFDVLLQNCGFLSLVETTSVVHHRIVKSLETIAGLGCILLHTNLGVTRVQVGFGDLLDSVSGSIYVHAGMRD